MLRVVRSLQVKVQIVSGHQASLAFDDLAEGVIGKVLVGKPGEYNVDGFNQAVLEGHLIYSVWKSE
jgi:hypothetical protein